MLLVHDHLSLLTEPRPAEGQPVHEPVPSTTAVVVINHGNGDDALPLAVGDFAVGKLLAGTGGTHDAEAIHAAKSTG